MDILEKIVENSFVPNINNSENLPYDRGIYLVCAKDINNLPLLMKNLDYKHINGNPVVYVGISKKQGIRGRDYKNHFVGSARNSTLRKSLGVLFYYERHYYNDGKYRFTVEHENQLSNWMKDNLFLYYYLTDENLDDIEAILIEHLSPPLNLKDNHKAINIEFRAELSSLRRTK